MKIVSLQCLHMLHLETSLEPVCCAQQKESFWSMTYIGEFQKVGCKGLRAATHNDNIRFGSLVISKILNILSQRLRDFDLRAVAEPIKQKVFPGDEEVPSEYEEDDDRIPP